MLEDEHEILGVSRVGSFEADIVKYLNQGNDCPINKNPHPDLCSAGTCNVCKNRREQHIADSHDISKSDFGFNEW